jgi:hypothetical protein
LHLSSFSYAPLLTPSFPTACSTLLRTAVCSITAVSCFGALSQSSCVQTCASMWPGHGAH